MNSGLDLCEISCSLVGGGCWRKPGGGSGVSPPNSFPMGIGPCSIGPPVIKVADNAVHPVEPLRRRRRAGRVSTETFWAKRGSNLRTFGLWCVVGVEWGQFGAENEDNRIFRNVGNQVFGFNLSRQTCTIFRTYDVTYVYHPAETECMNVQRVTLSCPWMQHLSRDVLVGRRLPVR